MAGILVFLSVLVMLVIILAISFGLYILNKLLGGFSTVRALFSQLFGTGYKNGAAASAHGNSETFRQDGSDADYDGGDGSNDVSHTSKKIFSSNEGEYVDFEEVK